MALHSTFKSCYGNYVVTNSIAGNTNQTYVAPDGSCWTSSNYATPSSQNTTFGLTGVTGCTSVSCNGCKQYTLTHSSPGDPQYIDWVDCNGVLYTNYSVTNTITVCALALFFDWGAYTFYGKTATLLTVTDNGVCPSPSPTPTRTQTPTPSTTPIVCGSGVTTSNNYYYTDCCGNFIQQGLTVLNTSTRIILDYTKPYDGITLLGVAATTSCPTQTPTPTPTVTPNNCMSGITDFTLWYYTDCCGTYVSGTTMGLSTCYDDRFATGGIAGPYASCSTICPTTTPTTTPTNTQTPTPTLTPSVTPSTSGVFTLQNQCDTFTLFDMGVQCYPISEPSSSTANDGILSLKITGGTSPYNITWDNGAKTKTIYGIGAGSYPVQVVDFYGDYTANTICYLVEPSPTPTTTTTPTPTPTVTPYWPNLCLSAIYVDDSVFGPLDFTFSDFVNGKPTWTNGDLVIFWNPRNNRWQIQGWTFNTGIPISTNESLIPIDNWSNAGGMAAEITVTEGSCVTLPLQFTIRKENSLCNDGCTGSISINAFGGTPGYLYSNNGGITYQTSPIFTSLCPGTYQIYVKDNVDTIISQSITVGNNNSVISYNASVIVESIIPLSNDGITSVEQLKWQLFVTPQLPIGTSISFQLNVNNLQYINGPGTGTIVGLTTINDGGITVPQATIQTQSITYGRPGCSLNTTLQTTKSQNYNLTLSYGETITGTSLSTLSIPNPQSADGCITKLVQSINISLNEIVINGCSCCVVNETSSPIGIQNHTLERGPSLDSPS
jgi:hypothetical protein